MRELQVDHVNKINEFDEKQQERLKELGIYDIIKRMSDLPSPVVTAGFDKLIAVTKGSPKQLQSLCDNFELRAKYYKTTYAEAFANLTNAEFMQMRHNVILELKELTKNFINEHIPKCVVSYDGIEFWMEGSHFAIGTAEHYVKFDLTKNLAHTFCFNLYSYKKCRMIVMLGLLVDEFAKAYEEHANKTLISTYLAHRSSLNVYAYPVHEHLVRMWHAGVNSLKFARHTSTDVYQEIIVQIGINEIEENAAYEKPLLIMSDAVDRITKKKLSMPKSYWSHNDYLLYIAQHLIEQDAFPYG